MPSQFLESLRRDIRLRGYSIRTEKSYLYWVRYFIRFTGKQHPTDVGAAEVKAFLSFLASDRHVAINTQKVALNALVYLYHKFLQIELGDLGFTLATKQRVLPVTLTPGEIAKIIACLNGRNRLIIEILYGSGLRISECLRLRIQDVDLERLAVTVRDGKGNKDRQTLLSPKLITPINQTITESLRILEQDNLNGIGPSLPYALGRKYPNAFKSAKWAYIFPSTKTCSHPVTGEICRRHLHQTVIRKALGPAVKAAGIENKKVNCHTFRHSFATHLLEAKSNGELNRVTPNKSPNRMIPKKTNTILLKLIT